MIATFRVIAVLSTLVAFSNSADADVKLQASASAQTSGAGIAPGNEQNESLNTGLLTVNPAVTTSVIAGPVYAQSTLAAIPEGGIFAFAESQIITAAGSIHGYLNASAASEDPGNVTSLADGYAQWQDTIEILSETLPTGTIVPLTGTVYVDYDVTASPGAEWFMNVVTPGLPTYTSSHDSPNSSKFVTGVILAEIGSTISLSQEFTAQINASADFGQNESANLEFGNTVKLFLATPAGVTIRSESRATYQVPEVPSALLVSMASVAAMALAIRRRARIA